MIIQFKCDLDDNLRNKRTWKNNTEEVNEYNEREWNIYRNQNIYVIGRGKVVSE